MPDAFDHRNFVRFDHGMPENPKVVGVSDAAFRLYVEAICWCSRQETNGRIPDAMMRRLGKPRVITELVTAKPISRVAAASAETSAAGSCEGNCMPVRAACCHCPFEVS